MDSKKRYRECKEHGDSLYPFETYRFQFDLRQKTSSQLCTAYHWHPELEILLIESGELHVFLESQEYIGRSGDVLFVNTGLLHSMYAAPGENTLYTALVFDLNLLCFHMYDHVQSTQIAPLLSGKLKFPPLLDSQCTCLREIQELLKHILSTYDQQRAFYRFETKIALLQLLLVMFREHLFLKDSERSSALSPQQISQLKEILSYIHEHYQEKIFLEDIADAFHLSPKYFSRYFKKQFGQTFTQYLNAYRIEQSLSLLEQNKCSISDAALLSGFESPSYYVKVFKAVMGITPGEFSRQSLP